MTPSSQPHPCVEVDEDLLDLVPGYLQNQRNSQPELRAAVARGDLDALHRAGHRLNGSALMYGFGELGELGEAMEHGRLEEMEALLGRIDQYLDTVRYTGRPVS